MQLQHHATGQVCLLPGSRLSDHVSCRSESFILYSWGATVSFCLLTHQSLMWAFIHPICGVCSATEVAPSWGPLAFHVWNLLWPFASRQYFWSNSQTKEHMPWKIMEGGKFKLKNWVLHLVWDVVRSVVILSALWMNLHSLWQLLRNLYKQNVQSFPLIGSFIKAVVVS